MIDLLRTPIEEQHVLIKIEFNRAIIMFELLCAAIELVRTNCVPIQLERAIIQLRQTLILLALTLIADKYRAL